MITLFTFTEEEMLVRYNRMVEQYALDLSEGVPEWALENVSRAMHKFLKLMSARREYEELCVVERTECDYSI